MTRRAVVTGATGFIGWHLCDHLRDAGWQVRALVRPASERRLPQDVERHVASLTAGELARAIAAGDTVFHLAAVTRASSRREFLRVNADATRLVARAARQAGARLVYVSSQAAAGPGGRDCPRTEFDEPRPSSPYGESKLAGEVAVRGIDGLDWTILRPVAVYGPRDRDFLTLFRLAARGIFPVIGAASTPYMLVHVADLVRGIQRAAESTAARSQTFFIGHPEVHDVEDILKVLAVLVNRRYRPLHVPRAVLDALAWAGDLGGLLGRPGLMNRSRLRELRAGGFVCCVDRVATVLGFSPETDLRAGLAGTCEWYRREGLLDGVPSQR